MTISAKIIADSISPEGVRLTTMQLRYPRFIHSEFMTHRMFSRNASSSRAVPVEKLIADIERDLVMPIYWGSNKPGMQAGDELDVCIQSEARVVWYQAMKDAIQQASYLHAFGVHKQIVNRLLEPFSHINVVVSATEWNNFYTLRRHEAAQPEIHKLADVMFEAQQNSTPELLRNGKWHLPYIDVKDFLLSDNPKLIDVDLAIKCSVARVARVSYLTHEGKAPDPKKDCKLYDQLFDSKHMSPFEHQATPSWFGPKDWSGNFRGWIQLRQTLQGENNE